MASTDDDGLRSSGPSVMPPPPTASEADWLAWADGQAAEGRTLMVSQAVLDHLTERFPALAKHRLLKVYAVPDITAPPPIPPDMRKREQALPLSPTDLARLEGLNRRQWRQLSADARRRLRPLGPVKS